MSERVAFRAPTFQIYEKVLRCIASHRMARWAARGSSLLRGPNCRLIGRRDTHYFPYTAQIDRQNGRFRASDYPLLRASITSL